MTDAATDKRFMAMALDLAARGLGNVAPNPAVGCVIVRDGRVVGRGWTQPGGRPHAETEALSRAGPVAQGATAYVTLEPCSHHGHTPPCAEALAKAGVTRVVVATKDPDPRVDGRGISILQNAGIVVDIGVGAEAARRVNAGFISRSTRRRPLVTLKLATTLDGRIATHSGESHWITGEVSRAWSHRLRAGHDAVMVGSRTAIIDDPDLTCRLPGLDTRQPVRVVVDSRLRLPLTARLVATATKVPTWLVTVRRADPARVQAFRRAGVEVMEVGEHPVGMIDPAQAFKGLAERGITRVLVEGGARLASSLFQADLVDRLEWFRAASVIGGDGVPAVEAFGVDHLTQRRQFRRIDIRFSGDDVLETFERAA